MASMRAATQDDGVDGVAPRGVCEPETPEQLAAALASAARDGLTVVPRGGGTKLSWGRPPGAIDLVLSTRRLNALVNHRNGDLTAIVQAGATLAAVNAELGRRGQWIPLDPSRSDRATIGGVVATNDSGPRRQRYGAPRDLIIGIDIARVDGRVAKAGGQVVKNVAGYDLTKVFAGSFGGLGVITSATFKLLPLPASSQTAIVDVPSLGRLEPFLVDLAASQLEPSAVELQVPPGRVLVRFESTASAAARQAEQVASQARRLSLASRIVAGEEERVEWKMHGARPWNGRGTIVKVSVLPGELAGWLARLEEAARADRVEYEVVGQAGLGVVLVRLDGPVDSQAHVIGMFRQRFAPGHGSAVIVRAEPAVKAQVDVWGDVGDSLKVMQAIKARFDPSNILNRGRTAY